MPLFEYVCTKCGHKFEQLVRNADVETLPCPECGEDAKQTIAAPSPFVWGDSRRWNS